LDPDDHHTPPAYALGHSTLRHADLPAFPPIMDSVTRAVGSPRVFGLKHDSSSYVLHPKTGRPSPSRPFLDSDPKDGTHLGGTYRDPCVYANLTQHYQTPLPLLSYLQIETG
jgi:hypothetical protein